MEGVKLASSPSMAVTLGLQSIARIEIGEEHCESQRDVHGGERRVRRPGREGFPSERMRIKMKEMIRYLCAKL